MSYAYDRQPVVTSELCFKRDADSFFSPVELGHTGFGFDGTMYSSGVPQGTSRATWSTEAVSAARGPLASFPTQALIIVSRAVVTIIDATTPYLNLWMLSYFADYFGYSDNSQGSKVGYLAQGVTWNNGVLSITMTPDAGAQTASPNVIHFDFTSDTIYADTRVSP